MAKKILTVATEVQKAVFETVILKEISSGFWNGARPADHSEYWKGVEVAVNGDEGAVLGAVGFEVPRNYNFVNPEFLQKAEAAMLVSAQAVDANMTIKKLRKEMIQLSRIVGGRLTTVGGQITKANRGQKNKAPAEVLAKPATKANVKRVAANIVDSKEAA
jgi:hypothetical protein